MRREACALADRSAACGTALPEVRQSGGKWRGILYRMRNETVIAVLKDRAILKPSVPSYLIMNIAYIAKVPQEFHNPIGAF